MTGFEFNGNKYKQASAHQRAGGEKLIKDLNLSGDERVLDLGCGDGAITRQLADLIPSGSILGIDASKGMIETALYHKGDNLSFELKDINVLDYKNEFDLVFSNAALHWIKDHDSLLNNIYTSLKRNGSFIAKFAAKGNCAYFTQIVKEAMELPRFSKHFTDFDWPWFMPEVIEYESIMKQSPFREVNVWGGNADRYFSSPDEMIKWVDQPAIVPFLQHLGVANREPFRGHVIERLTEETIQNDGTCFEEFRTITVSAKK